MKNQFKSRGMKFSERELYMPGYMAAIKDKTVYHVNTNPNICFQLLQTFFLHSLRFTKFIPFVW